MNRLALFAAALLLALAPPALATEQAAAVMADIVAGMNHFPNDEQKSMLEDISSDEEVDENLRTIAEAISNIEHQPADADKAKLQAIVEDEQADEAEKTLAGAVLRFNHQTAAEDKAALQALNE